MDAFSSTLNFHCNGPILKQEVWSDTVGMPVIRFSDHFGHACSDHDLGLEDYFDTDDLIEKKLL